MAGPNVLPHKGLLIKNATCLEHPVSQAYKARLRVAPATNKFSPSALEDKKKDIDLAD